MTDPAQLSQSFRQAQELLSQGELRKAADLCKHMLEADPHYAPGYYMMSLLFRATGDMPRAFRFAQQAIERAPADATYGIHLGQLYFAQAEWEQAASAFQKAAELDPYNALAVLLQADCLGQQRRFDEALILFRRARALHDTPETDEHEGLCLMMKGDLAAAALLFDRLLARRPAYGWGYLHKARLCEDMGKLEEAQQCYEQALACTDDLPEAQQGLAVLRQRLQLISMPAASAAQH